MDGDVGLNNSKEVGNVQGWRGAINVHFDKVNVGAVEIGGQLYWGKKENF